MAKIHGSYKLMYDGLYTKYYGNLTPDHKYPDDLDATIKFCLDTFLEEKERNYLKILYGISEDDPYVHTVKETSKILGLTISQIRCRDYVIRHTMHNNLIFRSIFRNGINRYKFLVEREEQCIANINNDILDKLSIIKSDPEHPAYIYYNDLISNFGAEDVHNAMFALTEAHTIPAEVFISFVSRRAQESFKHGGMIWQRGFDVILTTPDEDLLRLRETGPAKVASVVSIMNEFLERYDLNRDRLLRIFDDENFNCVYEVVYPINMRSECSHNCTHGNTYKYIERSNMQELYCGKWCGKVRWPGFITEQKFKERIDEGNPYQQFVHDVFNVPKTEDMYFPDDLRETVEFCIDTFLEDDDQKRIVRLHVGIDKDEPYPHEFPEIGKVYGLQRDKPRQIVDNAYICMRSNPVCCMILKHGITKYREDVNKELQQLEAINKETVQKLDIIKDDPTNELHGKYNVFENKFGYTNLKNVMLMLNETRRISSVMNKYGFTKLGLPPRVKGVLSRSGLLSGGDDLSYVLTRAPSEFMHVRGMGDGLMQVVDSTLNKYLEQFDLTYELLISVISHPEFNDVYKSVSFKDDCKFNCYSYCCNNVKNEYYESEEFDCCRNCGKVRKWI